MASLLPAVYHRFGRGYLNLWSTSLVGAALADARREQGMTQAAVADAAGLSAKTVIRAEATGRVSCTNLIAIAQALDLRLSLEPPPSSDTEDDLRNQLRSLTKRDRGR